MIPALAFFGAFNPPTAAHLELARFALEAAGRKKRSLSPPGLTISAMPRERILPMTEGSGWPCCVRRRRPAPGWT